MAGQQQVRSTTAAEECVLQHPQEYLRARLRHGGIQGSDAQGLDQVAQHRRRQAPAERRHGGCFMAAEAARGPARSSLQQAQPLAHGPSMGREYAARKGQQRPPCRQAEATSVGITQVQRQPAQQAVRVGADGRHQCQGAGVGADEDVLAVVELTRARAQPAGASAGLPCHLEQGHAVAPLGGTYRGGQPSPAGADHRHLQRHRHA
jgi:hypothetical protein